MKTEHVPWWKKPYVLFAEGAAVMLGLILYVVGWAEVIGGFWALFGELSKFVNDAPNQSKVGLAGALVLLGYGAFKAYKKVKRVWAEHQEKFGRVQRLG